MSSSPGQERKARELAQARRKLNAALAKIHALTGGRKELWELL